MSATTTLMSVAAVSALMILLFPLDVSAIWCFQCNSQFDPDCANLQPNETTSHHYKQCSDNEMSNRFNGSKEFFCRKIVQIIYDRDGLQRVIRRCGWIMHKLPCYSYNSEGHKDEVCQCFTDACNSAPSVNSGPIMWLSGALTMTVMYMFK